MILPELNLKQLALPILATVVVLLVGYCYVQRQALKQAEVIYSHPQVEAKVHNVVTRGPVRIVERIVRQPAGVIVTNRVIERGMVVRTVDSQSSSKPSFAPIKNHPWLLGVSNAQLRYQDPRSWTAYAGYSINSRLDLCGGITVKGRLQLIVLLHL